MLRIISILGILILATNVSMAQMTVASEFYNAGVEANNAGNLQEAIDNFNNCINTIYELEEESEASDELLYKAEAALPNLYYNLAKEAVDAGKIDAAIEKFTKTVEVAKKYGNSDVESSALKGITQLYYKKGVTLYKKSDFEGAIAALDKSLEYDSEFANAYYIKTVVYVKTNDLKALEEAADAGIALGENTKVGNKIKSLAYKAFLKEGMDLKGASDYEGAISNIEKAMKYDNGDATPYLLLLQVNNSASNWDAAIDAGNKAYGLEQDAEKKAAIQFELGKAYKGKGDTEAACNAYKMASFGRYEENAKYQIEHVLKCN